MSLNQYAPTAANAEADARAAFVRRTYGHLAAAIFAFMVLESILLQTPLGNMAVGLLSAQPMFWLLFMAAFMGVSWLADNWARSSTSKSTQYAGLGLYIVAEAFFFLPVIYFASIMYEGIIMQAAIMTSLLFGGLTYTVAVTRKDFSFLGPILGIGGFIAIGLIACSILFGFNLGLLFSAIMVAFAAGSILYTTSNIMKHYNTDQHVAASLSLFASVMLLFWYVLRVLMSLASND